jgi:hypothetical protein
MWKQQAKLTQGNVANEHCGNIVTMKNKKTNQWRMKVKFSGEGANKKWHELEIFISCFNTKICDMMQLWCNYFIFHETFIPYWFSQVQ